MVYYLLNKSKEFHLKNKIVKMTVLANFKRIIKILKILKGIRDKILMIIVTIVMKQL